MKRKSGFTDQFGGHAQEGEDVIRVCDGRRARMDYCGHDGSAWMFFYDTGKDEDCNWRGFKAAPSESAP